MAAGDDAAKADLVDRHRPRIIAALIRKGHPDAEGVADRVFTRVFLFADQYDPDKAQLGAWITWLVSTYSRRLAS